MGKYMYKTSIPTSKEWISTDVEYQLDDVCISLDTLRKFNVGGDDSFTIDAEDMTLEVTHRRLETDDEFNARVKKAVDYNKRYDDYHKIK
jgi:hypothetical protein